MKLFGFLLLISFWFGSAAQNLEFSGGYTAPFIRHEHGYGIAKKSGNGFDLQLGLNQLNADWHKVALYLNFSYYTGEFESSWASMGGGERVRASFQKSILGLTLYPIDLVLAENLHLNFGATFSKLIHEEFEGTKSGWSRLDPSYNRDLNQHSRLSPKTTIGIRLRAGYNIEIGELWNIKPQLMYYYGLTKDFNGLPTNLFSTRYSFVIGFEQRFNSKSK